jgi:Protein of unknown function (DUF3429)
METEKRIIPPLAYQLGIAGLIPFVVLAGAIFFLVPYKPFFTLALLAYGASICSFLGAIHWGLTMKDTTPSANALIWGVIPSLIGWLSLLIKPEMGLFLITGLLWLCFLVDSKIYPTYELMHWLPMRKLLTIIASISCFVSAAYHVLQ